MLRAVRGEHDNSMAVIEAKCEATVLERGHLGLTGLPWKGLHRITRFDNLRYEVMYGNGDDGGDSK